MTDAPSQGSEDADRAFYSWAALERLVEGFWCYEDGRAWVEAAPTWSDLRSRLEHYGELDEPWVADMLDLERAYSRLMHDYPVGGMLLAAVMCGAEIDDINRALRSLRMPPAKVIDKSISYLRAYMNGKDPKEAWRHPRRLR